MIDFFPQTNFHLKNSDEISNWISKIITSESFDVGEITYIFCDDIYLHKLNLEFLKHDTLTDILSFDNSLGNQINGEIYISIDRVKENSKTFNTTFEDELHRVIIHGIFHLCGFKDKSKKDNLIMRSKEDHALMLRKFV